MSSSTGAGPSKQPYRDPAVDHHEDDEDEDDLDDLDDVLASFNAPKGNAKSKPLSEQPQAQPIEAQGPSATVDDDGDEFEASLVEGMESLLRQLAGDHPPGPMPGPPMTASGPSSSAGPRLSKEAEEEAWQKALEAVLSGEGLAAMGLDDDGRKSDTAAASTSAGGQTSTKPSYEETLAQTMKSLNTAGTKPAGAAGADGQPDLAALLASLGGDPDLLKNLGDLDLGGGGEGDDGDLADVLEGMMGQLMTKEVLEEPMSELAEKYPPYLASPPSGTSEADLQKYRSQYEIVQKILAIFRKPSFSDEADGKEIAALVSDMQDLGGPPKEIMGDLPEGLGALGLDGAGGEDGCCIM
ncbi:hypothetical protein IAU60_003406 [Kwoniella sp. DSM 27419]